MKDIVIKVIKVKKDIFGNFIMNHFNYCVAYGEVPVELKHSDIILVHKKNEKYDETNYRPLSILTHISKIYEKFAHKLFI